MDDLSTLDWNARPSTSQPLRPSNNSPFSSSGPSLKPFAPQTLTGQSLSRPNSTLSATASIASPLKAASPANDSFANLVPSASGKTTSNLTIQDRQRQLLEERQKQIAEQQQRHAQEAQLWDKLGNGSRNAQNTTASANGSNGVGRGHDEDELLAAFSASAKVDKSSHFPPPSSSTQSRGSTPGIANLALHSNDLVQGGGFDDDDDPFGLGSMARQRPSSTAKSSSPQPLPIDEDFLGELGKPVQARPPQPSPPQALRVSTTERPRSAAKASPYDRSIAELVDMGFPAETARTALEETNGNVQTAVSWLLNQAHAESQQKAKGRRDRVQSPPTAPEANSHDSVPVWMRPDSRSASQPRRPESGASNHSDRDVSQYASQVGSAFFKSANSLLKAGRKQVQKAVAEFQHEGGGDPNQPKWMRDASTDSKKSEPSLPQARSREVNGSTNTLSQNKAPDMTDEALLLESGGARPQRSSKPSTSSRLQHEPPAPSPLRGRSPAQVLPERSAPPQRVTPQPTTQARQPTKLSREQVEEQASQAYVSSARRRKPTQPVPAKQPEPEVDLFSPAPAKSSLAPTSAPNPLSSTTPRAKPPSVRPQAPPRSIPAVSQAVLAQSTQHRAKGTEAFKRGDFDAAHQAYTAALTPLPSAHPIIIIVLSNRALTAIKTGDPKQAVIDADTALSLIGPSRGENEIIDLGTDGQKDMKEFFGKALSRKAEALEAMEKWVEAGNVWQEAVSAGVGGPVALRGRDRCARAADPTPKATSKPMPATRAPPRKVEPARPKLGSTAIRGSTDAVQKLRAQNEAAEKLDDEKFALSDSVTARIEGWRGGKTDNLRALLQSLDSVLWEGAGWKKVGMAELVLPNKVKIAYMKAIAKVHPDKIPQNATTEQRMISGSVFSTLNEAWEKFKRENGL